ncbi:S-adenosyl-L-methionine-dependentmethyltransferases superfamily protein [Striga asiatica]|uniref:S-adenosyl-L-methionine-dependentmethyltransferases superfamily protein n=1 Tax=Striga asiatica TaxID=4170 RepID=A0A5A7QY53_STRAF|nr:S-adenosyl-L-methionine-dependentmethyltransferases superfamily protein [Striga asiatica]
MEADCGGQDGGFPSPPNKTPTAVAENEGLIGGTSEERNSTGHKGKSVDRPESRSSNLGEGFSTDNMDNDIITSSDPQLELKTTQATQQVVEEVTVVHKRILPESIAGKKTWKRNTINASRIPKNGTDSAMGASELLPGIDRSIMWVRDLMNVEGDKWD